jgi:hypothetical protein
MNFKLSYQDSSGNITLFPYYFDGNQIVEGNAPAWTSDIYYFGEPIVKRDYGASTPWLTVVFANGNSWWTPWYQPGNETELPAPPPPPPLTPDPCINTSDFGIELRDQSFVTTDEASQYLSNSEIDKLASIEKYTAAALIESKNKSGRLHKFVCTNYYIDNLSCWIKQVSYDMVPEFDLFIAKYYFPNGIPTTLNGNLYYDTKFRSSDGYYYVTTGGRICYIQQITSSDPPPVVLPPKPDIITPETPLIGAGSVYSTDIDIVDDYEIVTSTLWPDGGVLLNSAYCHCDGSFGSTVNLDMLSFGFDVYNYPYNHPEKECVKKLFRVAFGDVTGSGIKVDNGHSMTKAIYSQYAQKILGDPTLMFDLGGVLRNRILILDFSVDLYKYELDPGNWQLNLMDRDLDGIDPDNFVFTDFAVLPATVNTSFIDSAVGMQVNDSDYSYDINQGTLIDGITVNNILGKIYPKHGVIVLAVDEFIMWQDPDPDVYACHAWKFYRLIQTISRQSDGVYSGYSNTEATIIRKREKQFIRNHFIRVKHYNFNLSNNPTFVDSESKLLPFMQNDPKTYITSVGLYNEKKELLAVGKFPKPIKKDFSEELVISVKLIQ